jgi:CRISPR-associated protein Cmr2
MEYGMMETSRPYMSANELRLWETEVLSRLLRDEPVPEALQAVGGGVALLSADTDKTKDFVFESAKLPEIRGASMILDELNQGWLGANGEGKGLRRVLAAHGLSVFTTQAEKEKAEEEGRFECVIYAGGGSFLALVPSNLAQSLCEEIEALYPAETGTATITSVAQPLSPNEIVAKPAQSERAGDEIKSLRGAAGGGGQFIARTGFQRAMALQAVKLRRGKTSKKHAPLFEASPYTRRCESCGIRSANQLEPAKGELTRRYLCCVCNHKYAERGERRSLWIERANHYWKKHGRRASAEIPKDLTSIGDDALGKPKYVGFIYADGNGVGRQVEESATLREFRLKSRALLYSMSEIVYDALYEWLYQRALANEAKQFRHFEIITIGGDDALIVVPADAALRVAHAICSGLGERLQKNGWPDDQKPTMSAGVVIAHADNPVYFMRDLAEQLLKSAKRKTRETSEGAVDFLILKSQSTVASNIGDVRSAPFMKLKREDETAFLTKRPYTLSELALLLRHAGELKRVGKTQLRALARVLREERLAASVYFLYQSVRLKDEGALLAKIHQEWDPSNKSALPWLKREGRSGSNEYETPWADLVEVLDFVDP